MKQLFATVAVSWDHGPASAIVIVAGLGLCALAAVIAAGPLGAAAVLLPLVMVGYSGAAYLRRTVDDRDQLLARVVAHHRLRRTHATLLSLELARPLLPAGTWSTTSSAPPPPTASESTPTA
jgi:hypothetical protein